MRKALAFTIFLLVLAVGAMLVPALAVGVATDKDAKRAAEAPSPKVAVINVAFIFSKWEKVKHFRDEFEKELKPFRDQEDKLKKAVEDLTASLEDKQIAKEKRERIEKEINQNKDKLEDLGKEYRKKVSLKTEDQLRRLYREMSDATKTFAKERGYDLVLGFGEPSEGDLISFTNVTRKMQAVDQGGVTPIYIHDRIDITPDVAEVLNRKHRAERGD